MRSSDIIYREFSFLFLNFFSTILLLFTVVDFLSVFIVFFFFFFSLFICCNVAVLNKKIVLIVNFAFSLNAFEENNSFIKIVSS